MIIGLNMKSSTLIFILISIITFACHKKSDISGVYYLKELNDTIVNDYSTNLILDKSNTYYYINSDTVITGKWNDVDGELHEIYLGTLYGLYNLRNGMTFEAVSTLSTDTSINRMVFEKRDTISK